MTFVYLSDSGKREMTRSAGRGANRRPPRLLGGFVLVLSLFLGRVLAKPPAVSVARLLNLYSAGQTDAAVALVASAGPDGFKLADFERDATDWLRFGTSGSQNRRVAVVSAFAVEAVRTRAMAFPAREMSNRTSVILWASHLLNTGGSDPVFEEDWLVASADVLRRSSTQDALRYLPAYLRAAEDQYPTDGPLRLFDAQRRLDTLPRLIRAHVEGDPRTTGATDATAFRQAAARLETVISPEWARSEALFYRGAVALLEGDRDGARSLFRAISPAASGPCTGYLSSFLSARSDEEDGRSTDAVAEYRAALAIVPRAQSATTRLALVLALANRQEEATSTIRDELTGAEPVADPWGAFLGRGCDHWQEMVEPLRARLRSEDGR